METGLWKREIDLATGSNARSGASALEFTNDTTTAAKIRTLFFPATATKTYALSVWVKKFGASEAADNFRIAVEWYDSAKSLISTASLTVDLDTISGTDWTQLAQNSVAPSDTVFAKVFLAKAGTNNFTCYVDDVELLEGEPWLEVDGTDAPPFENAWENYNAGSHETAGVVREGAWRNLKGLVKDGTVTDPIFTLADADRPPLNKNFAVVTSTGYGRLEVASDGTVTLLSGGNGYVSLDGVRWRVN